MPAASVFGRGPRFVGAVATSSVPGRGWALAEEGEQGVEIDGFDEVAVEARLVRPPDVVLQAVAGDRDEEDALGKFRAEFSRELVAVHARQADVGEDGVGPLGSGDF